MNRIILFLLKRFDVITVTGSYTRNYLISKGIDEGKIWILPHVVDEHFQPLSTIKKEYDLIFIGRLVRVKHVETIVRAVSVVKGSVPSIKLAIVGDGEERAGLEELTRSLGLTGNIEFAGYQANTWEWYNRGKISLLTSEREGFPYTVIESLKCGVPVIVSNCGDVTDVVKDSFNGRIIPDYRDYHAYAEAIIELLNNPDLLESYSKNCLKSFEDEVSNPVENQWDQILTTIERTETGRHSE
jgi:glycosyltransferase involved in cell wall biosynthesis